MAPHQTKIFRVSKSPSDALALTNLLIVSPLDFDASTRYIILDEQPEHVFPSGQIGTSAFHRRWAGLSMNQDVAIRPWDPQVDSANSDSFMVGNMEIEVGFLRRMTDIKDVFDVEEMSRMFKQSFVNQVFTVGQLLVFDFRGINLSATIKQIQLLNFGGDVKKPTTPSPGNRGILIQETSVNFVKASDSNIRLKGGKKSSYSTSIINPDFRFEDMGIGGLDSEFSNIFRRAFASRIFPPALVEKLGIQHVRGILLYGPPGTGKTLMARQIGKMLNAREPKVVNGPEILNKFVGQSEENIRKLFADAEKEYQAKGDESALHIIIFDELDAICKQRGGRNDGTGVGDSVVNQLLSKMDGVDQLNNILVIGMTNRIDMIDEALLRPGRLEVHMEISLPDETGRFQILKIHTSKMRENSIIAEDVNLQELAILTKNFSGAELNGLVKSATSFAFNRHVKVGTVAGVSPDVESMRVQRNDFLAALEEVKPAFGVSDEDLISCIQNKIIHYDLHVENILSDGKLFVEQVKNSERTPLVSILLHGPSGSGKTALAATIAMASEFPFIKLISPESMVGFSEASKMSTITKVFNDSYKSPLSVIVVDNLERLLDWVPIGPRFANGVLQVLLVLLKKRPPKNRKLFIIATTTRRSILSEMDMLDAFNAEIYIPNIHTVEQVDHVLSDVELFKDNQQKQAALDLLRDTFDGQDQDQKQKHGLSVGIKKLLMIAEMARQDTDPVQKLCTTLIGEM